MKTKLSLKQSKFVDYYLQTGNASKSAKLSGYNGNDATIRAIGAENLTKPLIKQAIKSRLIKDKITPDYVLSGISTIADNSSKDVDRLKAYELLGKYLKLFTDNTPDRPTEIILKLGLPDITNDKPKVVEPDNIKTIN
jgi:ribosome assembly protein YihI (activator of Der GTPase)